MKQNSEYIFWLQQLRGMEAEFQLPLNMFPAPSVSSVNCTGMATKTCFKFAGPTTA